MKHKSLFLAIIGAGLFAAGALLLWQDISLPVLPYLCIGVGCGLFGHGAGDMISRKAAEKHPELQKEIEIQQTDERSVAIANMAKAKAYDMMLLLFGCLMVAFALMDTPLPVILLLAAGYLFTVGYYIYFQIKFNKAF